MQAQDEAEHAGNGQRASVMALAVCSEVATQLCRLSKDSEYPWQSKVDSLDCPIVPQCFNLSVLEKDLYRSLDRPNESPAVGMAAMQSTIAEQKRMIDSLTAQMAETAAIADPTLNTKEAEAAAEEKEEEEAAAEVKVGAGLSEYELQRLRNIAANEAMLARLGLSGGLGAAGAASAGRGR